MLNLKYKLYNNKHNQKLHTMINTSCCIWNHCVALQKRYYNLYNNYIDTNKLQKHIAKLRKKNIYWKQLNSQTVQEICQRLDTAYKRFFKGKAKRPPKFKKWKQFSSFVLKQSGWKIESNKLIINKIGYKFSKSRNYEKIKRISIKRNKLGELYVILTCDITQSKLNRLGDTNIGLDFGLKTFLTHSDGNVSKSPEFFKNNIKNIQKLSKQLSRKVKGSNNYKKALKRLQRMHISLFNKREDYQWKLAHSLCKYNKFIAIEDLNIDGMKRLWGRKVSDLGFSGFIDKLYQVADRYGTIIQKIGRYYPSSRLCSCGYKNDNLTLRDRVWVCPECGIKHDRDLLASVNILTEGIRLYCTESKTSLDAFQV